MELRFWWSGKSISSKPSICVIAEGNFSVTQIVTTANGCKDTIIQVINIAPKPVAGFIFDTDNGLNIGAEFSFIDTSLNTVTWEWDLGNGDASSQQIHLQFILIMVYIM